MSGSMVPAAPASRSYHVGSTTESEPLVEVPELTHETPPPPPLAVQTPPGNLGESQLSPLPRTSDSHLIPTLLPWPNRMPT